MSPMRDCGGMTTTIAYHAYHHRHLRRSWSVHIGLSDVSRLGGGATAATIRHSGELAMDSSEGGPGGGRHRASGVLGSGGGGGGCGGGCCAAWRRRHNIHGRNSDVSSHQCSCDEQVNASHVPRAAMWSSLDTN